MQGDQHDWAFLEQYLEFIPNDLRGWVVPLIVGIVLGSILLSRVINPILIFTNNVQVFLERRRSKKNGTEEGETSESLRPEIKVLRDVWLKDRTPNSIATFQSSKTRTRVISVLNMKGGVGKTTLSANLGAAFHESGKRVLFIDYDYQASLSLMVAGSFNGTRRDVGVNSYKTLYPEGAADPEKVITTLRLNLSDCGIAGASYHLFRDEMEQFSKWSADLLDYDVRTQLREFVKSRYVQDHYDIVIIDCGPRFTTSTINALCGSTHFIVPTILDELSAQAVTFLDNEISKFRDELFPHLRLVGVIPTFVHQDPRPQPTFNAREQELIDNLSRTFSAYTNDSPLLLKARIPRRNEFSKHSDRIVYYESSDAKKVFDRAAAEVLKKL